MSGLETGRKLLRWAGDLRAGLWFAAWWGGGSSLPRSRCSGSVRRGRLQYSLTFLGSAWILCDLVNSLPLCESQFSHL